MRLRTRFVLALVAVGLVLSVTSLVGFALYRDAVVSQEQTDLQRTSESVATQLDVVLAEKRRLVRLEAGHEALAAHGTATQAATLATFVRRTRFSGASVIAANGTMTAIVARGLNASDRRALVGDSFADRTYFQRAMTGETYVSDPVDAESGFRIVTVSAPVREDGAVVGTLNAAFHVREGDLSEVVRTSSAGTRGIRVVADGAPVFDRGPSPDASETWLVANATVPSTGWTVSATSTRAAFGSRLWTVTGLQIGAFLLVLLSLAGFGVWLYREFVGNVERLSGGVASLVAGEYGTRVALSGGTEWNRLEARFNDLSETLAQRRTEVTVLNRVLRHNLRNAMTVVVGNADRIETVTDDERVAADARRIRRRGESLLELADHARALESSLGARDGEAAAQPVTAVLDEVVTVLAEEFPGATVTVDAEGAADAWVPDGDLLVVVLDELGRNGIVHNDGEDSTLRLAATADDGTVEVAVADDGPGLPVVERRVLTEPFVETPTRHGTGLGLWLVSWLVARTDGEIDVAVADGTTVTLTLPRVAAEDEPPPGLDGSAAGDDATAPRRGSEAEAADASSVGPESPTRDSRRGSPGPVDPDDGTDP